MNKWRLIDTGILSAAENISWDQAFLSAQASSGGRPILRFLQFYPPCILIGRHQSPHQEARISFIKLNNFHLNRRITGGGAIFFDPSQLGWEVIATRKEKWAKISFEKLYKLISAGFIEGLRQLGVDAKYRPRNDIEVNGRKISGTGGSSEEQAFLFQGTLLIRNCAEDMLRSLRVPAEKLGRHGLESLKERVVFLEELLSPLPDIEYIKKAIIRGFEKIFDVKVEVDAPNKLEKDIFNKLFPYYSSNKLIYKINRPENKKGTIIGISRNKGVLRSAIRVDSNKKRISSVQFWGDFFIEPQRAIYDLEALLKHRATNREKIRKIILNYLNGSNVKLIGLKYNNF
ncbi:lipoate--protein ligase family protein, partial [bacterium]|nr:lipoate--protein ligase family protein [bacterium]